jgi:rod shape determining protein RodA
MVLDEPNLEYIKYMYKNTKLKKIVNVYQKNYINIKGQGFGDFLRGSIYLTYVCMVLGLDFDIDIKREGYNLNQSLIAIGSGGLFGKGFLEGTQTKGGFVPEQHSDYIFTTLGEEWGFIGTLVVILLYVALILRLLYLAENQKTRFARIVGYGVASILFMHFFLNIAMLIKLFPTIGVPLPYFSYGGSSFWAFTILLFIFIKLDANKVNEW